MQACSSEPAYRLRVALLVQRLSESGRRESRGGPSAARAASLSARNRATKKPRRVRPPSCSQTPLSAPTLYPRAFALKLIVIRSSQIAAARRSALTPRAEQPAPEQAPARDGRASPIVSPHPPSCPVQKPRGAQPRARLGGPRRSSSEGRPLSLSRLVRALPSAGSGTARKASGRTPRERTRTPKNIGRAGLRRRAPRAPRPGRGRARRSRSTGMAGRAHLAP